MSEKDSGIYATEAQGQSLADAIRPYFDRNNGKGKALGVPFSELPEAHKKRMAEAFGPLSWDEMEASQRMEHAEQWDIDSQLEELLMLRRTGVGEYQCHLAVTPEEAAMLACGINPNREQNPSDVTTKFTTPRDYHSLLSLFQDNHRADSRRRTLTDWMNLAVNTGRKHHPWVSKYLLPEADAKPAQQPLPDIDISMLANPGQLIEAFGRYTKMDASWFYKWQDHPSLKNAIKRKGTPGRGRTTEPLFCPFLVMQGLMTKPRKGSKRKPFLNDETPWRMLKRHFAPVYDLHRGESPLDD